MNIFSINGDPDSVERFPALPPSSSSPVIRRTLRFDPPLVSSSEQSDFRHRIISTPNIRKNAHKYGHALLAMKDEFKKFLKSNRQTLSDVLQSMDRDLDTSFSEQDFLDHLARKSGIDAERFYLRHRDDWHIPGINYDSAAAKKDNIYLSLYCALRALNDPEITNVRRRNTEFINHLRAAIESTEYKENRKRRTKIEDPALSNAVKLVQDLSLRKMTGIDLSGVTHSMIDSAAQETSKNLQDIDRQNIGKKIGDINENLKHAGPEYEKSWWKLLKQKFQGEFGINNDTCGKSNVPYVRSIQKLAGKIRIFCRFGTPTIQESGKPTKIDPIFEAALDAVKRDGKVFLYFNHQRRDGKEGLRTHVIEALQEKYPGTFHCASIPLDGKIIEYLNPENPKNHKESESVGAFRNFVVNSFVNKEHGCNLPIIPGGRERQIVEKAFDRVKDLYFDGKPDWTKREVREAFWGIFNTELKLAIMQELNPDYINSACKDNKDRGGTLGTIDEVILLVKLGQIEDEGKLKAIVYNALAPFIVKYEAILNNPQKPSDHRLGYLIAVLNHIANLKPEQLEKIQKEHQKEPKKAKIKDQYFPLEHSFQQNLSPKASPAA